MWQTHTKIVENQQLWEQTVWPKYVHKSIVAWTSFLLFLKSYLFIYWWIVVIKPFQNLDGEENMIACANVELYVILIKSCSFLLLKIFVLHLYNYPEIKNIWLHMHIYTHTWWERERERKREKNNLFPYCCIYWKSQ